jgi:hypothetical protein
MRRFCGKGLYYTGAAQCAGRARKTAVFRRPFLDALRAENQSEEGPFGSLASSVKPADRSPLMPSGLDWPKSGTKAAASDASGTR